MPYFAFVAINVVLFRKIDAQRVCSKIDVNLIFNVCLNKNPSLRYGTRDNVVFVMLVALNSQKLSLRARTLFMLESFCDCKCS
jgi:hypothetical protein